MFISGGCFREVKKEMERTYKLDLQSINDENEINEFAEICKRYEVKKNDKQREI